MLIQFFFSSGNTHELYSAAEDGNTNKVKKMLADPHAVLIQEGLLNGDTPLSKAAQNGHAEVVALLLADKRTSFAANRDGNTPLHLAAYFHHYSFYYDRRDRRENYKTIELLLAHSDVNATNNKNETPLHHAMHYDCVDVIMLFMNNESINLDVKSLVDCAIAEGASNALNILLQDPRIVIDETDKKGALLHAMIRDNSKIIALLLKDLRFEVNAKDKDGNTPLHKGMRGMRNLDHNAMALLRDPRVKITAQNNKGQTPLYVACANSRHAQGSNGKVLVQRDLIQYYFYRILIDYKLSTKEAVFTEAGINEFANDAVFTEAFDAAKALQVANSAKTYALIGLIGDGFLECKQKQGDGFRFFKIAEQLNFDLQQKIANSLYKLAKNTIPVQLYWPEYFKELSINKIQPNIEESLPSPQIT